MTTGALLADCIIIDDMIGDTNKIDVVANKSFGGMILNYFTDSLTAKGYHVDNAMLTSVGLMMDRQHLYKLVQSVRTKETDMDDLPIGVPPFYLNDVFRHDSDAAQLWSMYDVLIKTSPEEGGDKIFVPASTAVGRQTEAGTLMIIFVSGFSVPSGKQYDPHYYSDRETVGRVGMQHISQVTVAFYIVDAQTGELLWLDKRNMQGGTIYKEKILRLADKIIEELP